MNIQQKNKRKRKPNSSPMQIQFWMNKINPKTNKFYTEQEAVYHIRSFRKMNIEYWLEHGFSIDESKQKIVEYQKIAGKYAGISRKNDPSLNILRIEFWIKRGYTENEAKEIISNRQKTFSLQKCIEKYGKDEGIKRFNARQIKWQSTLNNKPKFEILKINKSKSDFYWFFNYKGIMNDDYWKKWKKLCDRRHCKYIDNISDLKQYICQLYLNTLNITGKTITWFLKIIPSYLWKILRIKKCTIKQWLLDLNLPQSKPYQVNSKYHSYHQMIPCGKILRSKNEIIFYQKLIFNNIKIESVGEKYPNSNMISDFKVNGFYIEIAGLMKEENYRSRIIYKQQTFGAIILLNEKEYDDFITGVLINNDQKKLEYYTKRAL